MVTATRTLVEQGLADPRGCEYRSIRVRSSNDAGGAAEVATSGWVLPAEGGKPTHAIAWNGLVYPLLDAGLPADLDADVAGMKIPERLGGGFGRGGFNGASLDDEVQAIALESFPPLRVCLLLRLGRADLAEALWTRIGYSLAPAGAGLDLRDYGASYLTLAADFAWFRHSRAVGAHLRGDDALALVDLRALDAFRREGDAQAAAMGFPPNPPQLGRLGGAVGKAAALPAGGRARVSRYFSFLDQAPALLADQERRARERVNPPPPPPEGDKAATLIRALDQIAVQPVRFDARGAASLDQSATVRDLVALGNDAVEPLIQTLRTDRRLARSLSLNRGAIPRERPILGVDEAAYYALLKILGVASFGPPSLVDNFGQPVDRAALADQIQKYWDKNKNIPLVERWYRTLADDQAGLDAWMEAAGNIVRREGDDAPRFGGGVVVVNVGAARGKLQGEPLREGRAPTVAELLIRRIDSIRETPGNPILGAQKSLEMAQCLAAWDPAAAAPALRDLAQAVRERFAARGAGDALNAQFLAMTFVRYTNLRVRVGDASALADYAEWLKTTPFDSIEPVLDAALEPLWTNLDDPRLKAAADWLFGDAQSPWAALATEKGTRPARRLGRLVTSRAVEIPAFRKLVEKALGDDAIIGKAEIRGDGMIQVRLDDNSGIGRLTGKERNDPDAPPAGAKADLRARDFLAWQLSTRGDAPHYNPCWPEAKREAVIGELVDYLKRAAP